MGTYPIINILHKNHKNKKTVLEDHPEVLDHIIDSIGLYIYDLKSNFKHPIINDVTNIYDLINSFTVVDTLDEFNSKLYWDVIDNVIDPISNDDGDIIRITSLKNFVDKLRKIDKADDNYELSQYILTNLEEYLSQKHDENYIIFIGAQ